MPEHRDEHSQEQRNCVGLVTLLLPSLGAGRSWSASDVCYTPAV